MDTDEKRYDRFCGMWQRNRTLVWAICLRHAPIGVMKCGDHVQEVAIALWNDFLNLEKDFHIPWLSTSDKDERYQWAVSTCEERKNRSFFLSGTLKLTKKPSF